MDIRREKDGLSRAQWGNLLENLAIVVLAFYPLRHIQLGLDLGDTGYNYANYQYMGRMDSMWFFSTYLTNVVGNLLTRLPSADTLMGMNLYTGLTASMLALMGYFFCTRKLGLPRAIVFVGELLALSLCWCPTASFYNYLTYLFFLISSILLYTGVAMEEGHSVEEGRSMEEKRSVEEKRSMEEKRSVEEKRSMEEKRSRKKRSCLFWAGAFLGANVLVRFSNLPQMGMIVAVWAYDLIVCRSEKKGGAEAPEGFWPRTVRHTLWCLAGYVAALAVLLGYIHIRYGIGEYMAGIGRLFAMTDNATDYRPMSMITGIINWYRMELYWVARIGAILAGGMVLFAAVGWLEGILSRRLRGTGASRGRTGASAGQGQPGIVRVIHTGARVLWAAVCIAMIGWLYARGFTSAYYYSYDPIWHPGPVFLMLTMVMAGVRILDRKAPKEEKLLGGMVILILLITPIGSNNGVLPALNNLFLAAPFALWESWRFLHGLGEKRWKGGLVLSSFPAKGVLAAFLALCLFQFGAFGIKFAFAEGTGIQDAVATVDNNEMLRNIRMPVQKAQWMTELSDYVNADGLRGKEVILYGGIPSLSYYLQMPFAFNSWSEMDSYSLEVMERDMAELAGEIGEKGKDKPVVILEETYALFFEGKTEEPEADPKWGLVREFMDAFGYEETFRNGKFAVYR